MTVDVVELPELDLRVSSIEAGSVKAFLFILARS
jgi:hypothetical protein